MKRLIILGIFIVLITGITACGAQSTPPSYFYQSENNGEIVVGASEESIKHSLGLTESSSWSNVFFDLDSGSSGDPVLMYMGSSASQPDEPAHVPAPSGQDAVDAVQRIIIRTGDISLVVEDVEAAVESITDLANTCEGYVVTAETWQEGQRMVGDISIRVGAEYYETAIRTLKDMAVEVKSQSTSGKDVTEEYVDLGATLKNLQASEEQLLELMDKAGSVEEVLEVQKELASTREKIEQTQGRMQYLEQSAATSLIQVHLEHSLLSVEFSAYSRIVKEGENVWFRPDVSGGFPPYSYKWDFGDGQTGTEEQAYHAYRSDDSYTVTLVVTDDNGNSATYSRESYVSVLPGWSFSSVVKNVWNGIVIFGKILLNILIGIVISSPIWIVILIILYFVWWRPRKRKKKAREAGQQQEPI